MWDILSTDRGPFKLNLCNLRIKTIRLPLYPHLNAGEQLERRLKGVLIVEESGKLPLKEHLQPASPTEFRVPPAQQRNIFSKSIR